LKRFCWSLLLLLPVLASGPAAAQGKRLDGVAAVVNDDVVLESDIEEQLYLLLMRAQQRPDSSTIDTLRHQILQQLIEEKLIVGEAKRQGMTVTETEIRKEVDRAVNEAKERLGGEEEYRRQLARENTTEEKLRNKYRDDVERQILARKLIAKQLPQKPVNQTEAEAYFKTNGSKFPKMPAELQLSVIQIPATADSALEKRAHDKSIEARRRVVGGEKFAKVAAELSEDENTARSGGDLGFIGRGVLDDSLEATVFRQPLGQVSQPIRSPVGWHVVEVIERDTLKTKAGKDSVDRRGNVMVEAHARHIMIEVPLTEADADRAERIALKVREQAARGTDFGALARQYSRYRGKQTMDGDIGYISVSTLQPHIRAGLDTVSVGHVSEVLVNQAGFNIFKVTDRKPEREYQLEDIRDELPEIVAQLKQRERYDTWLQQLRTKASIEIRGS
jgi:peptidyl-prolyl cis-trans isomerase SurA